MVWHFILVFSSILFSGLVFSSILFSKPATVVNFRCVVFFRLLVQRILRWNLGIDATSFKEFFYEHSISHKDIRPSSDNCDEDSF